MSSDPSRVWREGWPRGLYGALRKQGFESASDFLKARPLNSYPELAELLGEDVAPVQVQFIQFQEAKESGRLREAALDGLSRKLREHLPEGWEKGDQARSNAMLAYSTWAAMVETRGDYAHPERLLTLWRALESLEPPLGWLPNGVGDDLLLKAFNPSWPEESAS